MNNEINREVAKRPTLNAPLVWLAFGLAALTLTGCPSGQAETPTPVDVTENIEYFVLDGVKAENGEPVRCAMYASGTKNTQLSKSWFGFSCDFIGTATFPEEAGQK